MNVGFYIPRETYIKFCGPLIDFLLEKGWRVFLFCDYRQKPSDLGYKADQFPAVEKIPRFKGKPDIIAFDNIRQLAMDILKNNVRVFFVVNFHPIVGQLREILKKEDFSFTAVEQQYFLELLIFGKDLSNTDVVYSYSKNWVKWWKEHIERYNLVNEDSRGSLFKQIEEKGVVVGVPEADQVKDFDDLAIRRKYGIDDNKKVVVLLPFPWYGHRFPLISRSSLWTHIIYKPESAFFKMLRLLRYRCWDFWPDIRKGVSDLEVTSAIRTFCDRNDALLIVKGRRKNPVAKHLTKMANHLFFDEKYYPFTTLELLFIADLSIGFWTMAIMESILAQTPSICLVPECGSIWPECEDFDFGADFSPKPGSFYNFKGVVYNENVGDFIFSFGQKTFQDYKLNPGKRDEFIKKFLGYSDCRACERIYEDLCQRLGVR